MESETWCTICRKIQKNKNNSSSISSELDCNGIRNVVYDLLQTAYDESELNVLQTAADSDADSDDEIGSFHDDGPDSSDQDAMDEDADSLENGGKAKDHDLEWDSSTVSY